MVSIFFKKKTKNEYIPQVIVGICGISRNIGVTHLCIALSNYLQNKKLESTAYIEINSTDQIANLVNKKQIGKFSLYGIDFFPNQQLHQLPKLLALNYTYYIIDFGVLNMYTSPEFFRCTYQFIVCSFSPWKVNQFNNFINKLKNNNEYNINRDNVLILGNSRIKEFDKVVRFNTTYHTEFIPYLPNPFQITSQNFQFFEKLIERN